jgi:hypothetical protein
MLSRLSAISSRAHERRMKPASRGSGVTYSRLSSPKAGRGFGFLAATSAGRENRYHITISVKLRKSASSFRLGGASSWAASFPKSRTWPAHSAMSGMSLFAAANFLMRRLRSSS